MNWDTRLRLVLIGVGTLALGAGVLFIVSPGAAAGLPFSMGAVGGVGVVVAVMGLYMVRIRWRHGVEETETPNPEYPPPVDVPGSDIDRSIMEFTELGRGSLEYRERIEDRVREAAISVISYRDDCTRAEADRRLETGSWTDDDTAAAFFGGEGTAIESPSMVDEAMGRGYGDQYVQAVSRTVDAIVDYAQMGDGSSPDREEPEGVLDRVSGLLGRGDEDEQFQEVEWNPRWVREHADAPRDEILELDRRDTNYWRGISAFGLLAVGVGVFASRPELLLSGSIGVAYAAYSRSSTAPQVGSLDVERAVSDEEPDPGDEITVQVSVENTGDATLTDLRLIDVIPDTARVVEGAPRTGAALRPGKTTSFTYTMEVKRGEHEWPLYIVARDASGSVEREAFVFPDRTVSCVPPLRTHAEMPVRPQTSQYAGVVNTKIGGAGVEFFSLRDYRPGDAMKRVHWKNLARTGELATVEFREEKAATVTLLFDTRENAYVAPSFGQENAVERSVDAATDVFTALYDNRDLVGLAAFDTVPCWLSPAASSDQLERARVLFTDHPALSPLPPDQTDVEGRYIDPMTHVRRQLPANSQIIMFSPLNDDYAFEVARTLDSVGHLVTVISPDATADRSVGQRLIRVERMIRINNLRQKGVRVLDWKPDEQLALELEQAEARWSG